MNKLGLNWQEHSVGNPYPIRLGLEIKEGRGGATPSV